MEAVSTSALIYGAQALGALLVAGTCHWLRGRFNSAFLGHWAISWTGLAVFSASAIASVMLTPVLPSTSIERSALVALAVTAKYAQLAWLLLGVRLLTGRATAGRTQSLLLLIVVALLGISLTAFTAVLPMGPRYFARVTVGLILGVAAFGWAAQAVWRSPHVSPGVGKLAITTCLAAYGVSDARYALFGVIRLTWPGSIGDPVVLGLADFFIHCGIAVGVVALILEEEVGRRAESVRQEQQALVALQESEARQRLVLENIAEIVYQLRVDGVGDGRGPTIEFIAGRFEDVIGLKRSAVLDDPSLIASVLHPDDLPTAAEALRRACVTPGETTRILRIIRPDTGETRWIEDRLVRRTDPDHGVRIFGVMRDITEQRQVAAALQDSRRALEHSQRLDALGRLAGGVAHEFNNLLTSITGYGSLIESQFSVTDPRRGAVEALLTAARRAADLTRQLLAFGRRQERRPEILQPAEVIARAEPMLRGLLAGAVELKFDLDYATPHVLADRGQIEHVLVNLTFNARDAMPGGGELKIAVRGTIEDDAPALEKLGLDGSRWAVITVTDSGGGMSDAVRAHLFEPFFTTRGRDGAKGLGLATAYGIVQQTGGTIDAKSAPGVGTTFTIYLPGADARPSAPEVRAATPASIPGTVLVVEDDDGVRELVTDVLVGEGLTVIEAPDATVAIEHLGRDLSIRLVLTDVVMPGISGPDLARWAHTDRPGLPVMFMTGYAEEGPFEFSALSAFPPLMKPFTPRALVDAVRAALR